MKILIMGCGNQGLAMASHLIKNNNCVNMWNYSYKTISKLKKKKMIYSSGAINGSFKLNKISTDIDEVLEKVILVATPSSAIKNIARVLASKVDESYTIVLNPGRTLGIIEFINELKKYGCKSLPKVAETQTIIYTCRKTAYDSVNIYALKKNVLISSINNIENIIDDLPICYKKYLKPVDSIVITSLGNAGMILHCLPVLLNIGWIENNDYNFKYYYDGITPTIANLLEQLDKERIRLGKLLGYDIESVKDWLKRTYNVKGNTLYEVIRNNSCYKNIEAPNTLDYRYLDEDIPCGLVPLESLANLLNEKTPVTSFVISLGNLVKNKDYRKIGRKINKKDLNLLIRKRVIE